MINKSNLTQSSCLKGTGGNSKIKKRSFIQKYKEHHYIFKKSEDKNHNKLIMKCNNKYSPIFRWELPGNYHVLPW